MVASFFFEALRAQSLRCRFFPRSRILLPGTPPSHSLRSFRCPPGVCTCVFSFSAKKLSSTDWVGFDLIWKKRLGNIALKEALETHIKFEEARETDELLQLLFIDVVRVLEYSIYYESLCVNFTVT